MNDSISSSKMIVSVSVLAFLLLLLSHNRAFGANIPEVRHLKGYRSPLDEGKARGIGDSFNDWTGLDYYYSDGEEALAEDFPDGVDLLSNLHTGEKPLCSPECQQKFSEALKAGLQASNNFDRFRDVCRNYNETLACMDRLEGDNCSNQETFHVLTSGMRYMCIEQRKAFESVIECVDAQAAEVEKECETVCHMKERMAHWAVQSGILDNFMQGALNSIANGEAFGSQIFGRGLGTSDGLGGLMGMARHRDGTGEAVRTMFGTSQSAKRAAAEATFEGIKQAARAATNRDASGLLDGVALKGPPQLNKRLTPDLMRALVQDGCELTRCQLVCIRVKFDAKCGGSAGSLLSETFVRPIAQAQEFLTYGHIAPFMGAFLPHQCDFMVKKEVLNEFRIPAELDDALHQKYDGRGAGDGGGTLAEANIVAAGAKDTAGVGGAERNGTTEGAPEPGAEGEEEDTSKTTSPSQPAEQPEPIPIVHVPGVSPPEEGDDGPAAVKGVPPGGRRKVSHAVGATATRKRLR